MSESSKGMLKGFLRLFEWLCPLESHFSMRRGSEGVGQLAVFPLDRWLNAIADATTAAATPTTNAATNARYPSTLLVSG